MWEIKYSTLLSIPASTSSAFPGNTVTCSPQTTPVKPGAYLLYDTDSDNPQIGFPYATSTLFQLGNDTDTFKLQNVLIVKVKHNHETSRIFGLLGLVWLFRASVPI